MSGDAERVVPWLVATPLRDWDLPDGLSHQDFLRCWVEIGTDPERFIDGLSPDEADHMVWHAGSYLQHIVWWSSDGWKDIDPRMKIAAIKASPNIIRVAAQATYGRCVGCLMFWEDIAGVRRNLEGGQEIWDAIGDALREQLATSEDECTKQSAEHGLEHYAETELEGW